MESKRKIFRFYARDSPPARSKSSMIYPKFVLLDSEERRWPPFHSSAMSLSHPKFQRVNLLTPLTFKMAKWSFRKMRKRQGLVQDIKEL